MLTYSNLKVVIRTEQDFYELDENQLGNRRVLLILDNTTNYDKFIFPDWIKKLEIGSYKYDLDNLPNNLETLILFSNYNKHLDILPMNLKYLYIDSCYGMPLNYLPTTLEELHICDYYIQNLVNLPHNLKKITMQYNPIMLQDISHCSLEKITFLNNHYVNKDNNKDKVIEKVQSIFGNNIVINFTGGV